MSSYAEEQVDAILYPFYAIAVLLILFGLGLAIFLTIAAVAFVVVLALYIIYVAVVTVVTITVATVRYYLYRAQEGNHALDELNALGWNTDPDDVFRMAFGVDNFSRRRTADDFDWFGGVVLGVDDEE